MDLPTYTNIWRIEKRLYKLYDFKLPMPLPVGQIAVFTAVAVPYVVILKLLGLPFSHTLLWLYILPPGALAWVVSRPVLESKRLPELVVSQLRYLGEPRTWCRMAPLAEKDEIVITARVWRQAAGRPDASGAPVASEVPAVATAGEALAIATAGEAPVALAPPAPARRERAAAARWPSPPAAPPATAPLRQGGRAPQVRGAALPAWPHQPARAAPSVVDPGVPVPDGPGRAAPVPDGRDVMTPGTRAGRAARVPGVPGVPVPGVPVPGVPGDPGVPAPGRTAPAAEAAAPAGEAAAPPAPPARPWPVVTVRDDQNAERPLRVVERALGNPSERRASGWRDHVVVVPGGHRPGRPDQAQRDRARARLPVRGGHRVVVLGCTVGAGQTVTALLTAEMLTSLRDDQVAVLDLNPGEGSLTERARAVPALTGPRPPGPARAEVVTPEVADAASEPDVTRVFELLSARYPVTLADPGAAVVPRVLMAADQLVLVAPASQDAASALTTTREWLEAHGHAGLADAAIVVLNGVSRHTLAHVEQAEALARGRCRAIVRVPWDDRLKNQGPERQHPAAAGPLSPGAQHAYTALSGVLIAALAAPERLRARS